jgi:beta-fructofuranosidase
MNDPNGMFVDANGTWHLYYQYDATGIVAGNQHWGHAVSEINPEYICDRLLTRI